MKHTGNPPCEGIFDSVVLNPPMPYTHQVIQFHNDLLEACTHVLITRYGSADFTWAWGLLPFLQNTHFPRDKPVQCSMQFCCPLVLSNFPITLVASTSLSDGRACPYTRSKTTANTPAPGLSLSMGSLGGPSKAPSPSEGPLPTDPR